MLEFTGERVIPGAVNPDLWNEHRARYLFAARLCAAKQVLELGCGTGYGAAELAGQAGRIVALDLADEALRYARQHYERTNLSFVRASAERLPFPPSSFDVVVAFELIEHLPNWPAMLEEVRRVLRPEGCFLVSTPNRVFYAESRREAGANPFHAHEFDYEEFRQALQAVFPEVAVYFQNHVAGLAFEAAAGSPPELFIERTPAAPDEANFFVAVCGPRGSAQPPALLYLPSAANALRERAEHIAKLEGELATKNRWLEELKEAHRRLVENHQQLERQLEERNRWAARLDEELAQARAEIERLNRVLAEQAAGYETKISELEAEKDARTDWARRTQAELDAKLGELAQCVELLRQAERTVEERTLWAQRLDAELRRLEARLNRVEASRWVRLGRKLGLGPDLSDPQ